MKVFVALNFGRDNETEVCGAFESRFDALRAIELSRKESLSFDHRPVDGPNGGAAVNDGRGDVVGHIKAFDLFGESSLCWRWNSDAEELLASSILTDDGSPLDYCIWEGRGDTWIASFEGCQLCMGTLTECLISCAKAEDEARSRKAPLEKTTDPVADFVRRLLCPEDLGFSVPPHVRDSAREALGMNRVES